MIIIILDNCYESHKRKENCKIGKKDGNLKKNDKKRWKRWKLTKNGELYFLLHLCAGFRQGRVFNNTAEKEIFIYLFKIFSPCWNKSMYKWWLVKSALFICYCWWPSGFSYRCANDSDFCNNSFDFCQNNCDHCRTNCDLRKMLICELQTADLHQRVFSFFDGVSLKENHFYQWNLFLKWKSNPKVASEDPARKFHCLSHFNIII